MFAMTLRPRGARTAVRLAAVASGLALAFAARRANPAGRPGPASRTDARPFCAAARWGRWPMACRRSCAASELTRNPARQDLRADPRPGAGPCASNSRRSTRAQRELHALAFGAYDETKARALADAVGRAHAELTFARARTDAQILQLLTPAQRKQLDEHPAGHPGHDRGEGPDQGPERHPPMAPRA